MRLIAFIVALLLLASPAIAKDWMEYAYPDHSFTVAFPAEPRIEPTTYQAADAARSRHALIPWRWTAACSR